MSIGGTLGLFLGVSLLSIVEVVYYFVVWTNRQPHNIRTVNTINKIQLPIQNDNNLAFIN